MQIRCIMVTIYEKGKSQNKNREMKEETPKFQKQFQIGNIQYQISNN